MEEALKAVLALNKALSNDNFQALFTIYKCPDLSCLAECPALEPHLDFIYSKSKTVRAPLTARSTRMTQFIKPQALRTHNEQLSERYLRSIKVETKSRLTLG